MAFFDLYLNGDAAADEIDDYIDAWHEHPEGRAIFEFLGMTEPEYAQWLRDPGILPEIARARREKRTPASTVREAAGNRGR